MHTQQWRYRLVKPLAILWIFSLFAFQSFLIPSSNAVALQKTGPATICKGYGSEGPVSSGCYVNPWQFTSSLNQGRAGHGVVIVGNHIYAMGGAGPSPWTVLDSVEYAAINPDGTLGPWQMISHMTGAHYALASVVANGHIYAIGDYNNNPSSVEQAKVNPDGTLGAWQPVTSLQIGRGYSSAIVVGNFLYVFGGFCSESGVLKSVERAMINPDGTLGPWQLMSSMNIGRSSPATVTSGSYIYVLGGTTGSVSFNSVERTAVNADGTLGPWQMMTPMLTLRMELTAFSTQGYIYALGGMTNGGGYYNSVERAAILTDGTLADWQLVDSMNLERADAGAAIINNRIYEIGGFSLTDATVGSTVEFVDVARIGIPPDFGVTINNGSLFTNQTAVTLTISARPNTYMIQVSNDGGFYGAQWEPCVLSKPWTIVQYGNFIIPRVVYTRFKDIYGVVSATYQDDIILDMAPPTGSISISPGPASMQLEPDLHQNASSHPGWEIKSSQTYSYSVYIPIIYTPPPKVTLHLTAQDDVSGVAGMLISDDQSFSGASWEPFVTKKIWDVPSNNTITVYAKFQDYAGNVSEVYSATYTP